MKRPILYCAISFCIGIALANIFIPTLHPASLCFISIVIALALFRNNILSHIFLYLALVFFGAAYYQNYNELPYNHIANFTVEGGRKVFLKGVVVDDPIIKKAFYNKKRISFTVDAKVMNFSPGLKLPETIEQAGAGNNYNWQKVTGLVKADIYTSGRVRPPKYRR